MRLTVRMVALALSSLLPVIMVAAPKPPPHRAPLHRTQRIQAPNPLPEKVAVTGSCSPAEVLGFTVAGAMVHPRDTHTATLLTDGRVLVAGGWDGGDVTAACEMYDPGTEAWDDINIDPLGTPRQGHTATLLRNGKVLVVGGDDGADYLSSAQLFNPANGPWVPTTQLNVGRAYHTATLLPDGKVLVTGGGTNAETATASVELYDPGTDTWTEDTAHPMSVQRKGHTATLLPNGTVLVAGGTLDGSTPNESAQIYSEGSGWSSAGALNQARFFHSATLLPNGTVLVAGGTADHIDSLNSSEIFSGGSWTAAGSMNQIRCWHTASLLPNGLVLVTGGEETGGRYGDGLSGCELFDPTAGTWAPADDMDSHRVQQTATLLPSGQVLIAGGYDGSGEVQEVENAELYDPGPVTPYSGGAPLWALTDPITPTTICLGTDSLLAAGSNFQGLSECSGGGGNQNSSTNYPLLEITDSDSNVTYVPVDPDEGWTAIGFQSVVVNGIAPGTAHVRIIANGIPSAAQEITVNAPPAIESGSPADPAAICSGTTATLTVTATGSGLSYQWYQGNSGETSIPLEGETSSSYTTNSLTETTAYWVHVTGTCGTPLDSRTVTVSVNELPSAFSVTGGGSYCSGGSGVAVGLSGSETGVDYQLYNDGSPVGPPVAGTSSEISFGSQTTVGTYTVDATNATTNCAANMTGSVIVTVNTSPAVFGVTGGGSYCSGGSGVSVGLGGSESGVNYQLYNEATPVGSAVPGTGSALDFGSQAAAGTYTVVATNATTSCTASMTGSATVTVHANTSITSGSPADPAAICTGTTAALTVSASGTSLHYQWYQGTAPDTTNAVGTDSSSFTTATLTATTSYWVRVTGTCGTADSRTATVTVIPAPTPTVSGASGNTCPSTTVGLSTQGGMADYQWYVDAGPIEGATFSSYTATASGTYTVSYSNGCGTGTSAGHAVAITGCAPPPETAPGDTPATAQSWSGKTTITWPVNSAATSGYHVYRGVKADLPNLLGSGTDSCTRATTPDASSVSATGISEDPSGVTGRFYWYLVTGLNWAEGTAGNATAGERIVNSPGACP